MPDDQLIRVLIGGRKYRVPSSQLERMRADGVSFESPDIPEAAPPPPAPAPAPVDPQHPEEVPRLASEDTPPPREPDTVQVGDLPKQPGPWESLYAKLTSGGADAETLRKLHEAQPKNPTTAMVENVAGMLAPPVLKGAGALTRIGAGMVNQGVSGGASGALNAALEGKDVGQGAAWGAGLGALGGAAGELVGSVVGGAGKLASGIADRTRVAAAGLDAVTRKELAKKLGVADLPANLAAMIEKWTPSVRGGVSALDRAEGLKGVMNDVGPQIDNVLRDAGERQGLNAALPDAWQGLQGSAAGDAAEAAAGAVTADKVALANALEAQAARLGRQPSPADLVGLRQRNTEWGQSAYGDHIIGSDRAGAQAAGQLRDLGEATLDDIIERATPETGEAFHSLNRDYGEAAMLERAARNRGAVEAGDTKAPGAVAAIAAGAVNGIPGLVSGAASGTRNLLTQALGGTRGLDAIAHELRGVGQRFTGDGIRALGNGSGAIGGRLGAALARQRQLEEEERY